MTCLDFIDGKSDVLTVSMIAHLLVESEISMEGGLVSHSSVLCHKTEINQNTQ